MGSVVLFMNGMDDGRCNVIDGLVRWLGKMKIWVMSKRNEHG